MSAQEHMGIPNSLRTPITVSEAKAIAAPLTDRARPDQKTAGEEVANTIMGFVGKATAEGVPDLAHRALQTVLKTKGITNDQAAAAADALAKAQLPPPTVFSKDQNKPKNYDLSYMAKDGYFIDPNTGMATRYGGSGAPETYSHDTGKVEEGFQPGSRFIPSAQIEALKKDPSLSDIFDAGDGDKFPGYGAGAARHFLEGGRNLPSGIPSSEPAPQEPQQSTAPDVFMPQPDALSTPEEDQITTTDEEP